MRATREANGKGCIHSSGLKVKADKKSCARLDFCSDLVSQIERMVNQPMKQRLHGRRV